MTTQYYYRLNDKQLVNSVATDIGTFHKPSFYKAYIRETYGREVSLSTIVKTLGTYRMRISRLSLLLVGQAERLLVSANNDINLCISILRRIYSGKISR
jgi:hypothetical protein